MREAAAEFAELPIVLPRFLFRRLAGLTFSIGPELILRCEVFDQSSRCRTAGTFA
jgi:hypothetical protein